MLHKLRSRVFYEMFESQQSNFANRTPGHSTLHPPPQPASADPLRQPHDLPPSAKPSSPAACSPTASSEAFSIHYTDKGNLGSLHHAHRALVDDPTALAVEFPAVLQDFLLTT